MMQEHSKAISGLSGRLSGGWKCVCVGFGRHHLPTTPKYSAAYDIKSEITNKGGSHAGLSLSVVGVKL